MHLADKLTRAASLMLMFTLATGCGQGSDEEEPDSGAGAEASAPAMAVRLVEPADGAVIDGSSVRIVLEVEGLEIVPAGTVQARSGHHHLLVNTGLTPAGQPIPATSGVHIHLGQAQTDYELTDLEPGDYTVIAVVGDAVHVPLDPPVVDTVTFTVGGGGSPK